MPYRAFYQDNKEKCKQESKDYYHSHKEKVKEYQDKYRMENPEKLRAIDKAYWEKRGKGEHSEHTKRWRANNPEKFQILKATTKARRRARLINAPGSFTTKGWLLKVEYYGWKCFHCRCSLEAKTLTLDHFKPLSKGGSNWLSNLIPSCAGCNRQKWHSLDKFNAHIAPAKQRRDSTQTFWESEDEDEDDE